MECLKKIVFIVIYRVLIDAIYVKDVFPRFSYMNFVDNRSAISCVISWMILLLFSILALRIADSDSERNSGIVVLVLFLISFVPFTTCIYEGMMSKGYIIYNSIFWFVLLGCTSYLQRKTLEVFPTVVIGNLRLGKMAVTVIGLLSLLLVVYISWKYAHFRLIFNLLNVYGIRAEAANYNYPSIIAYAFSWALALNPVFMGLSLVRKQYLNAAIFFCAQMLSFGINGLKTTFFMPFLVIVFTVFYRKDSTRDLKRFILLGMIILVTVSCIEVVFINTSYFSNFFIRRIFIEPNLIGEYYYDFFSTHVPDYFRSSFLRHFGMTSPYSSSEIGSYCDLIGKLYYKTETHCNSGLSSDAIANFGTIGCVITPVLIVFVLDILDKCTKNVSKRITITPVLFVCVNILSTTLNTVLLTHGLLLIMLLMYFIGIDGGKNDTLVEI